MADYLVTWQIDIEADSPEEAAKKALIIQRDPESTATVFTVYIDHLTEPEKIDLSFDEQD